MGSLSTLAFCCSIVFFCAISGESLNKYFRLSPLFENLKPIDAPVTSRDVYDVIKCAKLCHQAADCSGFFYDGNIRLCLVYDRNFKLMSYIRQDGLQAYEIFSNVMSDCYDVRMHGKSSGVYSINPNDLGPPVEVYCEIGPHKDDNWLVFQRRMDGSEDFYRNWTEYRDGFGNRNGEFWLGNADIHRLTSVGYYELRVELEAFNGSTAYEQYSYFYVKSEAEYFQLIVGSYSGTAGDSLTLHHGRNFTTYDRDYDPFFSLCPYYSNGGWWYVNCFTANLNGLYQTENPVDNFTAICWYSWLGLHHSFKSTVMKMRAFPYVY